jgi:hypothetical protein
MSGQNPTGPSVADIWGTPTTRLVERLWDACGAFMAARRELMDRRRDKADLFRAAQPVGADKPDRQLFRAVAADATMPRYLYLNQRQWEDAPPDLVSFVYQMGLEVRTSRWIPPDSGHLTRDEFPADEVGKAMAAGEKMPDFA